MKNKMNEIKPKIFIFALLSFAIILSTFSVAAYANPATVNLGEAGKFAIISSTAITDSVPTATIITGDIAVSPAAATFITGLACSEVVGTIHVVSAGGATEACQTIDPAYLTPTVLEYEAAYTDASSRTADAIINTALDGLTLTPGIYTAPNFDLSNNNNVTLDCTSTGSSGVFIFKTAGHLNIGTNANVNLIGGCQTGNVFWAVAGTTDILGGAGTESLFQGTVLGGQGTTEISLGLGSTVLGRLMSDKTISLLQNTITKPVVIVETSGPVFIDIDGDRVLDSGELFFQNIQSAVTTSVTNDTIVVTSGTYTEVGQILINKNLTIIGTGVTKPIIKPSADFPQNNNAASAWLLVNSGITFSIENVVFDGNGMKVQQAIRSHGETTIDRVDFMNIRNSANPYTGFAIANFGGTVPGGIGSDTHSAGGSQSILTVTNSTFSQIGRVGIIVKGTNSAATISDNTYTGKGDGDFLDYAFEAGAGGTVTITDNIISDARGIVIDGNGPGVNSTSAGILVTDYYGPGTSATIIGNTISDSTEAIAVGYALNDASVVVAHGNRFSGNGVGISSTNLIVNAENNYWGTVVEAEITALTSGNVIFAPFCADSTCASSSLGSATSVTSNVNTPAGPNVVTNIVGGGQGLPGGVSITFGTVTIGGATSVITSASFPVGSFKPLESIILGNYFDIGTTANFSAGTAVICLTPTSGTVGANTKLLHFESGSWADRTGPINITTNTVCSTTLTSFSPFVLTNPPGPQVVGASGGGGSGGRNTNNNPVVGIPPVIAGTPTETIPTAATPSTTTGAQTGNGAPITGGVIGTGLRSPTGIAVMIIVALGLIGGAVAFAMRKPKSK